MTTADRPIWDSVKPSADGFDATGLRLNTCSPLAFQVSYTTSCLLIDAKRGLKLDQVAVDGSVAIATSVEQALQNFCELHEIVRSFAAVFLALVSNRVLSTVSLGLVGRIGSTELAAAGLVSYPASAIAGASRA